MLNPAGFHTLHPTPAGLVAIAINLIEGHHRFLQKNTGTTHDPKQDFYVQNAEGVLANNRHFLGNTRQECQPNGDGTTEGQSLHILGYLHAYMATGKQHYLDAAIFHFDAYVTYFYNGQPIPDTPQRWICHWVVNAKEPVLAHYPLDVETPTHSGFKGVELAFTNGLAQVPHGAPYWGEYLDMASFAYVGVLAWDSMVGKVQALLPDGTADWSTDGTVYELDWIITWSGEKVGRSDPTKAPDTVLSTGHPLADRGKIQLMDTTVTGLIKTNFAVRLPVELGGYEIARNEPQHNRPLQVPLPGPVEQLGNAADAEEWFFDAAYILYRLTGEAKYKKALDCIGYTLTEYTKVDRGQMFFRAGSPGGNPHTDGISYSYSYPNTLGATYFRNAEGYIQADIDAAGQEFLEQSEIIFRIDKDTKILVTAGGIGAVSGAVVSRTVEIEVAEGRADGVAVELWRTTLPPLASLTPVVSEIPVSHFERVNSDSPALLALNIGYSSWGGATYTEKREEGILGTRLGTVVEAFLPNTDSGLNIQFWTEANGTAPMGDITYRADKTPYIRFEDLDGWRWYWVLPNTNGEWQTFTFKETVPILSGYQPNATGTEPTVPHYGEVDEYMVGLEYADEADMTFAFYALNGLPEIFEREDGFIRKFTLITECAEAFSATAGNCTVVDFRNDSLAYTPGIIPFSNNYVVGTDQIDSWHGMPYPGYQYPVIFVVPNGGAEAGAQLRLNNMVDFLYDSQQWYALQFGVMGPGASAYVWDRWDNRAYGPPNTFTMYHWGDDEAWSGYQPRAFAGAARAWYELTVQAAHTDLTLPPRLVTYTENWVRYLVDFLAQSGGASPTYFPPTSPPDPTIPQDFTGHISGLYLAGCCYAALSGCTVPGLDEAIETLVAEIAQEYIVTPTPGHSMNGSWSPWESPNDNEGMFYGFWAGEILRGLGLYVLYKRKGPLGDIYTPV